MLMGAGASQVWKDDRAVPAYVAAKGGWRISYVFLVCGRDLFALWSCVQQVCHLRQLSIIRMLACSRDGHGSAGHFKPTFLMSSLVPWSPLVIFSPLGLGRSTILLSLWTDSVGCMAQMNMFGINVSGLFENSETTIVCM